MDRERLSLIAEKYGPLVFRRCLKLMRNREEAEDASQEIFMRLCDKIDKFSGRSSMGTWIYRVATNHCLNLLKKRSVERKRTGVQTQAQAAGEWFDVEQAALFAGLLSKVDADTAEIAVYHYLDGMTQDEISDVVSLSRKTVGRKIAGFEETCRRLLSDEGIS